MKMQRGVRMLVFGADERNLDLEMYLIRLQLCFFILFNFFLNMKNNSEYFCLKSFLGNIPAQVFVSIWLNVWPNDASLLSCSSVCPSPWILRAWSWWRSTWRWWLIWSFCASLWRSRSSSGSSRWPWAPSPVSCCRRNKFNKKEKTNFLVWFVKNKHYFWADLFCVCVCREPAAGVALALALLHLGPADNVCSSAEETQSGPVRSSRRWSGVFIFIFYFWRPF